MAFNFFQTIDQTLRANPEKELLVWHNSEKAAVPTRFTGQAILDRVSIIGQQLIRGDVKTGQKVLIGLPVGFDLICSMLAVMGLGAVPVLPPAAASERLLFTLIRHERIKVMITGQKLSNPQAWALKILKIEQIPTATLPPAGAGWLMPRPVDPAQLALVSHSSGSTGKPKSIQRSHQVLSAQHHVLKNLFPAWPGQRDFPLFPNILLHNLAVGTTSILPNIPWPAFTNLEPATLVRQILNEQVNSLTGTVFYFRQLLTYLEQHPTKFLTVRAVGIGGSPVPEILVPALKRFFPVAAIYIIYGSSEAEPIAIRQVGPETPAPERGYLVGRIYPTLQYRMEPLGQLLFGDGTAVTAGEIWVRGAHVATASRGEWWHSGDYGYINENQELYLTGRKGNERLHQGVQHYQVEHVLLQQPHVQQAAARTTETGFIIYIQGNAREADLRQVLTVHFPKEIIQAICFRDHLPVDARHHSKVRYEELQ